MLIVWGINSTWRMLMDSELIKFIEERNAMFTNPNIVDATAWWRKHKLPKPVRHDVPLATVHKARLQWLDVTDAMIIESTRWLLEHGYKITCKGAPPLTPERRDADRRELGLPPLGSAS